MSSLLPGVSAGSGIHGERKKINPCAFPLLVSDRTEQNALLCPDYYRFEMEYYPR